MLRKGHGDLYKAPKKEERRKREAMEAILEDMNLQLDSRLGNATFDGTASMVGKKGVVTKEVADEIGTK